MLLWFNLLLATLTLSTLFSATGVLFVKPTNDTQCPQQPCHTLEHYAQSWQLYLTSNTMVQFLPGEHVLEGDWNELTVENILNLTLIGSDSVVLDSSPLGIPMATSRISCRRGKTLFLFYNVTELSIARLTFSECGGGKATLTLDKVSSLVLDSVTIKNSTGTGLFGINLRKSLIHHSAFIFNQAANAFYCSGNVFLLYSICSERIETYTLNITSLWILFGNATTDTSMGGLCLQVGQSCYNVKVNIHNTTLKENAGGNMMIVLNGFAGNIITIVDSHFEGGYSSSTGGGLQVATSNDISQVSHHVQNNCVYINNTKFVGNLALLSGGAISVFSRTGTELYINASKFYSNAAFEGGHIAITRTVSTPHTCGSVIININSSLFENGTASDGGGVIIKGPNGMHISVSNTQFVRNNAQHRGGTLSLHGHTSNTIQMATSCYNTSRVPQSNLVYINNTEFVGNYAKFGGAVAIHPNTGTEVHINGSKFHSNVAHDDGGHIHILLLKSSLTYTNATITIKYSLLKDGNAFFGGGIAVGGPLNTFQCIHGSHITISKTKFMGNYAEQNGGGLSLYGCIGTELHIVESEFYNNTTPKNGGHIGLQLLSLDFNIYITVNNSHFESGKAHVGAGILVFAIPDPHDSCMSVNNSLQKSVYIMNSKVYQNIADYGGGLAIQFNQRCYAIDVLIHNISLSKNTATNSSGGNLYLRLNTCTAENFVTISRSTLEYGNASFSGGGMKFLTDTSEVCSTSLVSIKPTTLTIADSTFQYNTAYYQGGGLAILFGLGGPSEYFCCGAEVKITNVTFLNNKISTIPYIYPGGNISSTRGGNIFIYDISGNNSVRIHSCWIEGGVAMTGGGILLLQSVKYIFFWQKSIEIEGFFISSSQLICNQVANASGASLDYKVFTNIPMVLNTWKPAITKAFTITDTFDGSCADDAANVITIGLGLIAPYIPTWYSVIFVNVSFRGYSTNISLPQFHSQELSDISSDGGIIQYSPTKLHPSGVMLFFCSKCNFY